MKNRILFLMIKTSRALPHKERTYFFLVVKECELGHSKLNTNETY